MPNKRLRLLILEWQERADELVRSNPGRSKGWIADQIAKEAIAKGWSAGDIKNNIHFQESPKRRGGI